MNHAALQTTILDPLDRQIARFVSKWGDGLVPLAAGLASRNVRLGHVCLDLSDPPWLDDAEAPIPWPSLEEWHAAFATHAAVGVPGSGRPLILDRGRIYLARYHSYEKECARHLLERVGEIPETQPGLEGRLSQLFDTTDPRVADQLRAARSALTRRLCIISGGPGTGKTATAVRILACLASTGLRIGVAAPTGKAADRLQVALRVYAEIHPSLRAIVPQTLHRLLRVRSGAPPTYGQGKPLPLDVVLVDECSMVDLASASKLFDALAPETRLVLLGDHNQLASVEAGAILGDLAAAAEAGGLLADSFVRLTHNFRFETGGPIAALCDAILSGDAEEAMRLLQLGEPGVLHWIDAKNARPAEIEDRLLIGFAPFADATSPRDALSRLDKFRVLCAVRHGRFGSESINTVAARLLPDGNTPLLVTRNDYGLGVFNGDAGVAMHVSEGQQRDRSVAVWFAAEAEPRNLPLAALPPHEPAFAITIHKSQGSEFDEVLCILPEATSPILTRELLYTAASRARHRLVFFATEESLRAAINRPTRRESGLRERLAGRAESVG